MHMYCDGGYFMGGMHWIWWLFWLALIGAIVFYGWGGQTIGNAARASRRTRC